MVGLRCRAAPIHCLDSKTGGAESGCGMSPNPCCFALIPISETMIAAKRLSTPKAFGARSPALVSRNQRHLTTDFTDFTDWKWSWTRRLLSVPSVPSVVKSSRNGAILTFCSPAQPGATKGIEPRPPSPRLRWTGISRISRIKILRFAFCILHQAHPCHPR